MTRLRSILSNYKSKVKKVIKDNVNHPSHYTQGAIECIDAIKEATKGLFGIEAVCTGNIIKYVWRWKFKNGIEDLDKASWYLDKLRKEVRSQKKN
jgi:hypothetical protein